MANTDDNYKKDVNAHLEVDENSLTSDQIKTIRDQTEKFSNMPPRYIRFTVRHKRFWILLNLANILLSIIMAMGSVYILGKDQDKTSLAYAEC